MHKIVIAITAVLTAALVITVIVLGASLQAVTRRETSLNTRLTDLTTQITQERKIVTAQETILAGTHRDLITCGDMSQIISSLEDGSGSPQDYTGMNILPAHCINQ